jgi:hypothetical protein
MRFRLAGTPQPTTEEATGTSSSPGDLLVSGRGYKNIITKDLLDDPLLTIDNMRYFQKISKERYKFTLVRHDCSSAIMLCRIACLNLPSYTGCGQTLPRKIREARSSGEWPPGTPSEGSMHIRRTPKEHVSSERARQAEVGADTRNMASQERSPQS